jgi:hypothetical protein
MDGWMDGWTDGWTDSFATSHCIVRMVARLYLLCIQDSLAIDRSFLLEVGSRRWQHCKRTNERTHTLDDRSSWAYWKLCVDELLQLQLRSIEQLGTDLCDAMRA